MMTLSEFIEITGRAERYYEKQYSTEQMKIMYEELKNIAPDRYRQIIAQVIRTNKFLPKISDILEKNTEMPHEIRNIEDVRCDKCNGTGYILYTKKIMNGDKESKYIYGYVCDCGNAQKYDGRTCKKKSEFYTPLAKELNLI